MQPQPTRQPQAPTPPAAKRLTLSKETLRRLTAADLRRAAGGLPQAEYALLLSMVGATSR